MAGKHPNVFCPSEAAACGIPVIEDISPTIFCKHKEVNRLHQKAGGKPKFVFS